MALTEHILWGNLVYHVSHTYHLISMPLAFIFISQIGPLFTRIREKTQFESCSYPVVFQMVSNGWIFTKPPTLLNSEPVPTTFCFTSTWTCSRTKVVQRVIPQYIYIYIYIYILVLECQIHRVPVRRSTYFHIAYIYKVYF